MTHAAVQPPSVTATSPSNTDTVTAILVTVPPTAILETILKNKNPIQVNFHVQPEADEYSFFKQSGLNQNGPQMIEAVVTHGREISNGTLVIKGHFQKHGKIPFTIMIDPSRQSGTITRHKEPGQEYAKKALTEE